MFGLSISFLFAQYLIGSMIFEIIYVWLGTTFIGKLILISNNCPPLRKSEIEYYAMLSKVGVHHYNGSKWPSLRHCMDKVNTSWFPSLCLFVSVRWWESLSLDYEYEYEIWWDTNLNWCYNTIWHSKRWINCTMSCDLIWNEMEWNWPLSL